MPTEKIQPQYINEPFRIGDEISVTGKWMPRSPVACSKSLLTPMTC